MVRTFEGQNLSDRRYKGRLLEQYQTASYSKFIFLCSEINLNLSWKKILFRRFHVSFSLKASDSPVIRVVAGPNYRPGPTS